MNRQELHRAASLRADAKIGFYVHLAVYVLVNLVLAGVNLPGSPSALWLVFPLAGWGLGLAVHAVVVFVPPGPYARGAWAKGEHHSPRTP